ncbi:MAG TPA: LptF/LptG family permease [Verrucomicrobiae bacterium]
MRLLDRYLLRQLLVPLGYCLSGFLLLWVAQDLITELSSLQRRKLLAGDIAEYYLVKTPEFLVLILPMALLLSLLYALSDHARHHELTAIRASGVSLWRLCVPYFAVGALASMVCLGVNELFVPDSADAAEQIRTRRLPPPAGTPGRNKIVNLCFTNSRDGRVWRIGVYDVRTGEMIEPVVSFGAGDGSRRLLNADRAARVGGVWTFYNAREYKEGELDMPLLKTNVLREPLFSETPEEIRSEIKISAALGRFSMRSTKKADLPIVEIANYLRLHPNPPQAAAIYTKLHGRLATPWTCLVVVLIAIPFGAPSGRRNVFVGVAGSVVIFFLYFILQQSCLALGPGGTLPAWVAGWLPNLAFGLAGAYMMSRVR